MRIRLQILSFLSDHFIALMADQAVFFSDRNRSVAGHVTNLTGSLPCKMAVCRVRLCKTTEVISADKTSTKRCFIFRFLYELFCEERPSFERRFFRKPLRPQLCSADVVPVKQSAGSVSNRIESRDHASFVIDHLSVRVNLRTAERRCNTALKRESVVRSFI